MHIAFKTRQLRDLCESQKRLEVSFGAEGGEFVRGRLAELRASQSFSEIEELQLYDIQLIRDGTAAILTNGRLKVEVTVNQKSVSLGDDGSIHWGEVTRVLICTIEVSDA